MRYRSASDADKRVRTSWDTIGAAEGEAGRGRGAAKRSRRTRKVRAPISLRPLSDGWPSPRVAECQRGGGGFAPLYATSRFEMNCSTSAVNLSSLSDGLVFVHHHAIVESGTAMYGDGMANVV